MEPTGIWTAIKIMALDPFIERDDNTQEADRVSDMERNSILINVQMTINPMIIFPSGTDYRLQSLDWDESTEQNVDLIVDTFGQAGFTNRLSDLAANHSLYLRWLDNIIEVPFSDFVAIAEITRDRVTATMPPRPASFIPGIIFYFVIADSGQSDLVANYTLWNLSLGASSLLPSNLSTTSVSQTAFTANWTLPTTHETIERLIFEWEYSVSGLLTRIDLATTDNVQVVTGLNVNSTYRWRVGIVTPLSGSGWSEWEVLTTVSEPPDAPTTPVLIVGNTYLEYEITPPHSADQIVRYDVQHRETGTAIWETENTRYLTGAVVDLTNGTSYDVRCRAITISLLTSAWSRIAMGTPVELPDPIVGIPLGSTTPAEDARLWGDIYDVADNRLGDGPLTKIIDVTITKSLDRVTDWSLSMQLADPRAYLLIIERRIKIFAAWHGVQRELIHGIIRKRMVQDSIAGPVLTISGQGIETELKRINVLPGRRFNNRGLQQLVDELNGLTDWTLLLDHRISDIVVNLRFDGVSILKALQSLYTNYGIHLRIYPNRILYISRLGQESGLRISRVETLRGGQLDNGALVPAINMSEDVDSDQIFNRLYVFGGGEGNGALTFGTTTRTSPYPIRSILRNGSVHYYIEDTASIARYGLIEKLIQFKAIVPVNNSRTAVRAASNFLYDTAVQFLQRYLDPMNRYNAQMLHRNHFVHPGDMISIDYKAFIETSGQPVPYLNVQGDNWISRVSESYTKSGPTMGLAIQNVDRPAMTAGEIVLSAVESIDTRDLKPSVANSGFTRPFAGPIDVLNPLSINVEITETTLYIHRVRLRLETRRIQSVQNVTTGEFNLNMDSLYPSGIRILIDGTDRTAAMFKEDYDPMEDNTGFTLVPSGAPLLTFYEGSEIASWFEEAALGLISNHTLQITCTGGRGEVRGEIEIYQTMQSIVLEPAFAIADDTGTRPPTPQNPRTFAIGPDTFSAAWDPVSGATYALEIIDQALGETRPTTPGASLVLDNLIPFTIYQWRVAAVIGGIYSEYTLWQTVVLMTPTAGRQLTWQGDPLTWQGEDLTWQ